MNLNPTLDDDNKLSESLLSHDVERVPTIMHNSQPQKHPAVPIIQVTGPNGEAIEDGSGGGSLQPAHGLRGETQIGEYRDTPFAAAFVAHLVGLFYVAFAWGTKSWSIVDSASSSGYQPPEASSSSGLSGIMFLILLSSFSSMGIAALTLELMTRFAEQLIQLSLATSCSFLGLIALAMIFQGFTLGACICLVSLAVTCMYAYFVWHRIPFSAANLKTGITSIKANYGVCGLAYSVAFLTCLWTIVWGLAVFGVTYKESCKNGICKEGASMDPIAYTLLLVSFFWTAQVLKNLLHVTIAGVIGTWWFAPQDANAMCSPAIVDSLCRASTYSFGSICMGSLLLAIIQTLENLAHSARRHGRNTVVLCVAECLLHIIRRVAGYFNKWAFIYVGLYGYDYLTAGKKVLTLFQERGWTTIISDSLVVRVLMLICIANGAITGLVAMMLESLTGWAKKLVEADDVACFVFFGAFVLGVSLARIIMGVVLSAVDTVVVSFAEAPNEFQTNHPQLFEEMTSAWRIVYPNEFGF